MNQPTLYRTCYAFGCQEVPRKQRVFCPTCWNAIPLDAQQRLVKACRLWTQGKSKTEHKHAYLVALYDARKHLLAFHHVPVGELATPVFQQHPNWPR